MNFTPPLIESSPLKLCAGWCFRCRSLACERETLFTDMAKMSTSAIVLTKIALVKRLCFLGKSAELAESTTLFVVAMDHPIRQDRLKSRGEECLKRMDQYSVSIEPIMEPANGKDQAVKWTVRLLENTLHCSCRTPWIEQWTRVDGCSFPILEKIKDSKLLFSRKYYVGRGGAVNLLVKVNKAFMMQYFCISKV